MLTDLREINKLGGIQATNTKTGVDFYIEPGSVLHDLALAGQLGTLEPYVEEPDPVDLPAYATPEHALEALAEWADGFVRPLVAGVPLAEQLARPLKGPAAVAYKAGTADPDQTALIEDEAAITGEMPADLADLIIARAAQDRAVASALAGLRRKVAALIAAEADPYKYEAILLSAKAEAISLAKGLGLSDVLGLD